MIHGDERTEQQLPNLPITKNVLSEGIRLLLSSYTKGINKQENKTGNLIQQKTKSKCVYDSSKIYDKGYAEICFQYIHQNPLRAGLVNEISAWDYSSFRDYVGLRNGTLCNKELARTLFDIEVVKETVLNEIDLQNIW